MCKLDAEKEGRKRRKEGRKEKEAEWEGAGGWEGERGGGAALSCTGINMTQRQPPEPLLSSPIPPYRPRGGGGGTVSMATAEQR